MLQIFLCCLFMNIFSDRLEKCTSSLFFYLCGDIFECLFEDIEPPIYIFVADDERWLDTDSFGTIESTTDEDSSFEEHTRDLISDLFRCEVLPDEESLASDRLIYFRIFRDECLESLHHVFSLFESLTWEVISEHDMDACDSCTTCERSTTSRRRMDKWIGVHHALPYLLCRYEC